MTCLDWHRGVASQHHATAALPPGKGLVSAVRYIMFEVFNINESLVSAQQMFNFIIIIIISVRIIITVNYLLTDMLRPV